MSRHFGSAALSLALLGTACAGGRAADGVGMPSDQPETILIETTNDHFYDARVHAIYAGGKRQTLGTIPGNGGQSEVAITWEPRDLVFEISFVVSGASYVTWPMDVTRGQHLELRLPPNIDASGFFRRVSRD
jgi:hypothetical protein